MRRRAGPVLALLVAAGATTAAGCAPASLRPGLSSCGPREVSLVNASAVAVEQLFLGTGAPSGWGADLLRGRGELPSGAALPLRLPGGAGPLAVRAVWANGRAAELGGLDGCTTRRITVQDAALRAE